jgi:preprotein translocase subunit SecD
LPAAPLRGVAWACVILSSLALSSCEALAEPLRLGIASASAGFVQKSGEAVVDIRLTDDGRRLFADFTQTNLGHMIDLRIDGKSVNKPVVREPTTGGVVQINVDKPGESERLAARLNNRTATLEVEAVSH